jgi:[acyl-carrier-protein] S-malonyltransferase
VTKKAFIFPGQGSQYVGMGKELADNFKVAADTFAEADDALGGGLAALCFTGSAEALKLTINTQPAILTTSIAAFRVLLTETGISADYVAGHSLGEFSALVAAGALPFADAVRLVRARGSFMQEAVAAGTGAMAAIIGVEGELLRDICNEAAQGEVVAPANYNSPGQVVIAGHSGAVNRAMELAEDRHFCTAILLPVSAPFHSALMVPVEERLRQALATIQLSSLHTPVISNVEARANTDCTRIVDLLVTQVCAPVRWHESVTELRTLGVDTFVEIGPGKVLSGLIKKIDRTVTVTNVEDCASLRATSGVFV